jgi:uncharacterized membrane protein
MLIAIILGLGLVFRFANLDQKPYWHDEVYTSLRISGYTIEEVTQKLYDGQVHSMADLLQYQQVTSEKRISDTLKGLAQEEPQHPPLYYAILRLWAQCFGSSPTAMRSLSALISLAVLPLVYWLSLELFLVPAVGWMAVVLCAVSPIYIRYAQEARQYSLWLVMILFSGIALLRAMRCKTKLSWGIYSLGVTACLYCHLLSGLLLLGYGVYVWVVARLRWNHLLQSYLLTTGIGCLLFTPWLWRIYNHQDRLWLTIDWLQTALPFSDMLQIWSFNLWHTFLSWNINSKDFVTPLAFPVLLLITISVFTLCRRTPPRIWLFIVILMMAVALPLMVLDVIYGGRRSISDRYFLPSYLGIYLAVAYLLVTQVLSKLPERRVWKVMTGVLISASILSCTLNAQSLTWWGWSEFDIAVADIINQSAKPFLVSDAPLGVIMPVAHRLKSDTHVLLLPESGSPQLPEKSRDVFIYNPSDRLSAQLTQQGIVPKLIYQFREYSLVISLYEITNYSNLKWSRS